MDIELLSLDRLPLPSLEVYALLSIIAASSSMYYLWMEAQAFSATINAQISESQERHHQISDISVKNASEANPFANAHKYGLISVTSSSSLNESLSSHDQNFFTWHSAIHWASQQPHCVWVSLVNYRL